MLPLLASKLPNSGTTIFSVMSALANRHNAINLSQGFPDFPISEQLESFLVQAVAKGMNQYAPMPGSLRLRNQVALLNNRIYNTNIDPETQVTITSGATEALFDAITAIVSRGDEVIILEPAYDSYVPAIQLNGGIPVPVSLDFPDYTIPWQKVWDAVNHNTRAIIINSPNNPTGAALSAEDIQQLMHLVQKYPLWIISDEVYEHFCFHPEGHHSVLQYPELASRAFKISSFGKTFHVTGWKTGYCIAPTNLTEEFRKIHQFVTFASPTPLQEAIADMLESNEEVDQLMPFYQKKRDMFLDYMKSSRFKPLPCRGTYFQLMDYSEISQLSDIEFARQLTIEYGVASIPVSAFYAKSQDHKVLRFCFAKKEETLIQAADLLCKI
jgi:methionine transaminase